MRFRATALQQLLLGSVATGGFLLSASPAIARDHVVKYNIPPQTMEKALRDFGLQNGMTVLADASVVRGMRTAGLQGRADPERALKQLLTGTGLSFERDGSVFVVKAPGNVEPVARRPVEIENDAEIIVTAQKKAESIQKVPIAVSAFSAQALDDYKIEGGSELLRAIPNVTFSKSNFSMYNFSIRGIGTKSISASSDPAVAVSFNNTPLVRNRLFEAEFFDVERVEVLRGPQGTLYGRNATAGVVNMIPALPTDVFGGEIKGEVGNYKSQRVSGMVNVPLSETLGVRVAGAWTKRDGFDFNTFNQTRVNGRDLWSVRAIAAWEPSDSFRANLIWQRFKEDDDRARTGKQLCHTDPGPEFIGDVATGGLQDQLSQGCVAGSLYDDAAFGVPNGRSLVYLKVPADMILGYSYDPNNVNPDGRPAVRGPRVDGLLGGDPFAGITQSRNLREISTSYDPKFRAKNDVVQLNLSFRPSDGLELVSQTAYSEDFYFSTQDYNRFATNPIFSDSTQPLTNALRRPIDTALYPGPTPGGVYCDPQLGCSNRMISADLSQSKNRQWSQEIRLQSSFDGPLNFNIGTNYLDFKTKDDYYVFNNLFTYIAEWYYGANGVPRVPITPGCELGYEKSECVYVDPNPIGRLNNQGHNYFLSQNGVRIKSYGLFGELYWQLAEDLKLTLGARYTGDKKVSTQVPSQLLLGGGVENEFGEDYIGNTTGGRVNSGYPALPDIRQKWGEFTGRAVLDWSPDVTFADDTLVYLSASRGYKGGGTNPPRVDFNTEVVQYQFLAQTFKPEFVNALEFGVKNTFLGGRFTLNANAFYYDYTDYQLSQIVDRIAYNENFDATSMGLEFEAAWRPSRAFRANANLGFLKTKLGKGSGSIDVMDRTQGDPDWVVLRPWLQVPSNCVAPRAFVEKVLAGGSSLHLAALCPGATRIGTYDPSVPVRLNELYDTYGFTYNPLAPYNPATVGLNIEDGGSGAPNGGRGHFADVSGNELPNAPRWTLNVGAQYTLFLDNDNWEMTLRGDFYRQGKSYARIYNTQYDRLRAWNNVNISLSLSRPEDNLTFNIYAKNLFNDSPIVDFFTNSDDTGLTTNVFTLDPRIIGLSVLKSF